MQVPDDGTLAMAKTYMIIIFIGIIGNLGFNINSGILQGLGEDVYKRQMQTTRFLSSLALSMLRAAKSKPESSTRTNS